MFKSKLNRALLVNVLALSLTIVGVPTDALCACTCPGANDSVGSCSDTGVWNDNDGGDGWCGSCSGFFLTYPGGGCSGGGEGLTCNNCNAGPSWWLQNYTKTDVGTMATAACYVATGVCVAAMAVVGTGCVVGCVAFVEYLGWGTVPCAELCGTGAVAAAGGICGCLLGECLTTCNPVGAPQPGGSVACCQ